MNLKDLIKIYLLNKYTLIVVGIFFSFHSSEHITELGTHLSNQFWFNDEGLFFNWARQFMGVTETQQPQLTEISKYKNVFNFKILFNTPINFDILVWKLKPIISYKLFLLFISGYFLFLENPFLIVFTHKLILSLIFILFFYKNIIQNYGYKIFMLLFFCFCYLNSYFLRDSIIFLIGLTLLIGLPAISLRSKASYYLSLALLFFLRPQSVFIFIKWKYSILFLLSLLLLFLFKDSGFFVETRHLDDSKFVLDTLMVEDGSITSFDNKIILDFFKTMEFFLDYLYNITLILNSINPFTKLIFFFEKNLYISFILIFVSSISIYLFLFQMALGIFVKVLNVVKWKDIICGLFVITIIYSFLQIPMDLRVFVSMVAPFFIFFNDKFLSFKPVGFVVIMLFFLYVIKFLIF